MRSSRIVALTSLGIVCLSTVVIARYAKYRAAQNAPIKSITAEVIGNDYRLYFRYPGEDMVLHTPDDRFGSRDLFVPADSLVKLSMTSWDYIYVIEIPEFEFYEVAAPDIVFDGNFDSRYKGKHELLGSQMCSYDHPGLLGKLIVQSPSQFRRTMKSMPSIPLLPAAK